METFDEYETKMLDFLAKVIGMHPQPFVHRIHMTIDRQKFACEKRAKLTQVH